MPVFLKFNDRIKLDYLSEKEARFTIHKNQQLTFTHFSKALYSLITKLNNCGVSEGEMREIVYVVDQYRAFNFIDHFKKIGLLDYIIKIDDKQNVVICPKKQDFRFPTKLCSLEKNFKLSPYVYLKHENSDFILKSPLATCEVKFNIQSFSLLTNLLQGSIEKNQLEGYVILVQLLIKDKFLVSDHEIRESNFWEFHDLLFHTESRAGSFDDISNFGATYRFKNSAILPKKGFSDYQKHPFHQLHFSDKKFSQNNFLDLLKARKSTRDFTNSFMLDECLDTFLYYTASVKEYHELEEREFVKQSFPSAGGIPLIEFYVIINRSRRFSRDIYYYHPIKNGLFQLQACEFFINQLVDQTCIALGNKEASPAAIVVLTSKFRKSAWIYERISYSNTLKSVGCAIQTMYLVATAMNMPCCALGSGNPFLFAESIGLDPLDEGSVGEFVLG